MSTLSSIKSDLSLSTTKRYEELSAPRKASKLNTIREKILIDSGVVAQSPEFYAKHSLQVINAYLGVDKEQEAELSRSLFSSMPQYEDLIDKSTNLVHPGQQAEFQVLAKEFAQNLRKDISLIPFVHTTSLTEVRLSTEDMGILTDTLIGTFERFISKNIERLPAEEREKAAKELAQLPALSKEIQLNSHMSVLSQRHSQKPTLLKLDRPHLVDTIKEIVAMQKICAKLLSPIVYKEGDSQGFTFTIKKDGAIRGYLYGTMHYLNIVSLMIPQSHAEKLAKISKDTQKNLYECALLCTEVVIKEESEASSVEGGLIALAKPRGIVNLGIDDEHREYLVAGTMQKPAKDLSENLIKLEIQAQYQGDLTMMESLSMVQEGLTPPSKTDKEVMFARNISMTDNIDHMLKACYAVGVDRQESPPKCFFAVGSGHLYPTRAYPESVVKLLSKKGWVVELVK